MGIFSDKCDSCGNIVKKRAKFCSKCGNAAPKAWVRCSSCKKWVGAESTFCPHCKANQHIGERQLVEGNIITRTPGTFLQRIDVDGVRSQINDYLVIEEGTQAICLENGVVKRIMKPGKHNLKDGFLKKLFSGGSQSSQSLFIVDAGDFALPFSFAGLRSQEDMAVSLYSEALFCFSESRASELVTNFVKNKRHTNYQEFGEYLNEEIKGCISSLCTTISIDTLIKDPDMRFEFENHFRDNVNEACERIGIKLVRVSAIDFYGPDYERLRGMAGDLEVKTRESVLTKRLRELTSSNRMEELKSDFDLKTYEDQLAHEYNIGNEIKSFERDEIINELRRKLEIQESEHQRSESIKANEHRRVEEVKEHKHGLEMKTKTTDFEVEETMKWAQVRREKEKLKKQSETDKLDTYANYTIEQLATILPPEQVEQVRLVRQQQQERKLMELQVDMTPEQILALAAMQSPEAAQALADMTQAKNTNAEVKAEQLEKNMEAMERIMNKAIKTASDVASSKNKDDRDPPTINVIK